MVDSTVRTHSLADALFGKAKQAALGVLFSRPERALHLREIARLGKVSATAMQRVLNTLLSAGILLEERRGNQRLLRPNPDCPLFPELKGMAAKTFGVADRIKTALKPISGIEVAFIFGSVAKGEENAASDVDLVVVGTCSYHEVLAALSPSRKRSGARSGRWSTRPRNCARSGGKTILSCGRCSPTGRSSSWEAKMASKPENLKNLAMTGALKPHEPEDWEIASHLERAKNLLHDARLKDATLDGRYNNAYSAAHALAQAAFKLRGFRTTDSRGHRQTLFSALEHAVPAMGKRSPSSKRLTACAIKRNTMAIPSTFRGAWWMIW